MNCPYEQEFPRFLAAPLFSPCILLEGHPDNHVVKDPDGKLCVIMRTGQNPKKEYVK